MANNAWLLLSTVAFRPYVFIFLLMYLTAASYKVGPKKAVLFTLSAWFIAYISEFSSVRNGIPFGLYHYIPSTVERELWIFGVPFMDSLSFTFLSYASWCTARALISPARGAGLSFEFREKETKRGVVGRFTWDVLLLGATLQMLLDVVIDPLSLRGDRWFLGKIYYYPEPGAYFGVTIANFAGWFAVALVTLSVWGMIDRGVRGMYIIRRVPTIDLWGPALYYTVLVFNLAMTFWIGEYQLGFAGMFIFLPVTAMLFFRLTGRVGV